MQVLADLQLIRRVLIYCHEGGKYYFGRSTCHQVAVCAVKAMTCCCLAMALRLETSAETLVNVRVYWRPLCTHLLPGD